MDMEMKKNLATTFELRYPSPAFSTNRAAILHNERVIDWLDRKGFLTEPVEKACASCKWNGECPLSSPNGACLQPDRKHEEPKKNCSNCGWLTNVEVKIGQECTPPDRAHWMPIPLPCPPNLIPRHDHELFRMEELSKAIHAAVTCGMDIPREWTDEFNELLRRTRG